MDVNISVPPVLFAEEPSAAVPNKDPLLIFSPELEAEVAAAVDEALRFRTRL